MLSIYLLDMTSNVATESRSYLVDNSVDTAAGREVCERERQSSRQRDQSVSQSASLPQAGPHTALTWQGTQTSCSGKSGTSETSGTSGTSGAS